MDTQQLPDLNIINQKFILLSDAVANLCHHGIPGLFLLVAKTEIYGRRHWFVVFRISYPVRIPDGWGYGSYAMEHLRLVAGPKCKEPCQGIASYQAFHGFFIVYLPLSQFRQKDIRDKRQGILRTIAEGNISKYRRSRPGSQFAKPVFHFKGNQGKGFCRL